MRSSTRSAPTLRRRITGLMLALMLGVVTVAQPQAALAEDRSNVGLWVGCGFIDLLYTPSKLMFFFLMGITGGLSAMVTVPMDRVDITTQMVRWGFYGDWLVRPDHFEDGMWPEFAGEDEIRFIYADLDAPPGPWAHGMAPRPGEVLWR